MEKWCLYHLTKQSKKHPKAELALLLKQFCSRYVRAGDLVKNMLFTILPYTRDDFGMQEAIVRLAGTSASSTNSRSSYASLYKILRLTVGLSGSYRKCVTPT